MTSRLMIFIILTGLLFAPIMAHAEIPPVPQNTKELSEEDRLSLARQFLKRVPKAFSQVNRQLSNKGQLQADQIARMPEGEELLFNLRLPKVRLVLDAPLMGRAEKGQIVLSLRDFVSTLEFPIEVNAEAGTATGWYVREQKPFLLDVNARNVTTENGVFQMSEDVTVKDGDIFVPVYELERWTGFKLRINLNSLEINLDSVLDMPVEERIARQGFKNRNKRLAEPELPLKEEPASLIDYPFVDVSTLSAYRKDGLSGEATKTANASVRTTGDFLGGTLTTQTQLDKEEKLTDSRINYKQESLKPELLGPLKARRFEVGDVNASALPVRSYNLSGLGARVTNIDPIRGTLRPSTQIRGTAFPGWDVELYRDDQLVEFEQVQDDGTYLFEDIELFAADNVFRVVLYGPQGEIREEEVSIPVDPGRLLDGGSTYDVTVAAQDTQAYRKRKTDDEDEGVPALNASYETALNNNSSLLLGVEAGQRLGEQGATAHAGIATRLAGTLYNFDTAVDSKGGMAAEVVARRAFGEHQVRNELGLSTEEFTSADMFTPEQTEIFSNRLTANGPLSIGLGNRPRYNLGLGYIIQADGNDRMDYNAGLSTSWKRIAASQQFTYTSPGGESEDMLNSVTSLTGSIGRNRLRLTGDYQLMPENRLERANLDIRRSLSQDLELNFNIAHQPEPKVSEFGAQVNWNAGFANISPGITYNTDKDVVATLNTRFGLARDATAGTVRMYDRAITSNGGVSAFVFLDKEGDGQFNNEDERLEGVVLHAPQNGGSETTDEKGEALFTRMSQMLPTDVYVDESTLDDPFWIAGYKGASVIPREGHVTSLAFPIHMAGELDGTLYVRDRAGTMAAMRGIPISLYDLKGKKVLTSTTGSDGFFLLEKIPPGKYMLTVDGKSFENKYARPKPQEVEIGYDGTTIYGKNIYLEKDRPDVPVNFYADASSMKVAPEALHGRSLFLNLGTYKSRLTMGIAWLRARGILSNNLAGMELLEKPSESYPDVKTGKYTLRLLSYSDSMNEVYEKCRMLTARGVTCSVDVVPEQDQGQIASK